jgi:preprotein translocase subunit SecE
LEPTSPTTTESNPSRPAGQGGDGTTQEAPIPAEGADQLEAPKGVFGAAAISELRKVVWPSRQQLFSESVAVILMVGLSAAAIAAIDRFYGWVATLVFR